MVDSYKSKKTNSTEQNQQRVQRALAPFEDSLIEQLPTAEQIIHRALARQKQKRQHKHLLLLAGLGSVLGVLWLNPSYDQKVFSTGIGEQKQFELTDGSRIQLNTQTQLILTTHLRSRELKLLQGEASFTVKHTAWHSVAPWLKRSFVVWAKDVKIEDIGTVFNVRCEPNGTDLQISVSEGQVRISSAQQNIDLYQGQSLYRQHDQWFKPTHTNIEQLTSWQTGSYQFMDQPLVEVIDELNRYGNLSVEFRDRHVEQLRITGEVKLKHREQFMQDLEKFAPVNVTVRDQGGFVIASRQ
ncbi:MULTISPECIES: FecR family protein [unclassified Acinetobacter]|uniref:FecR family protein n=1 Tax=unclassified Acinetobacter TaxID=196816 RepID=UPI00190AA661|nr:MULTISPECIES: FecR domain-containing protein [unclassified Acinetobacter]MBK0065020.1 FecR domain-containing protein [Acinetobacter sp. S55]MBK0065320.1 FecR domain-containing protein [Acinetobacter sp. S54]